MGQLGHHLVHQNAAYGDIGEQEEEKGEGLRRLIDGYSIYGTCCTLRDLFPDYLWQSCYCQRRL